MSAEGEEAHAQEHTDAGHGKGKGKGKGGAPPWINHEAQSLVKWREGDVVVSVPGKSGTTWTMNIVHQLREGGDENMTDLYQEVRWLEFAQPGQSTEDLAKSFDDMPTTKFRAFKSHACPPLLPYQAPGAGPLVKYIVVVRNPDDVATSMYPFLNGHKPEFCAQYGVPPMQFPSFEVFMEGFMFASPFLIMGVFGFLKSWWALRKNPNVLILHYKNMVKDHDGHIRKIQDFLGLAVDPEVFSKVSELTSFSYMKAHGELYEATTIGPCPIMNSGTMVRKGGVGTANDDGMTAEISQKIRELGIGILGDNELLRWLYEGGETPDVELDA